MNASASPTGRPATTSPWYTAMHWQVAIAFAMALLLGVLWRAMGMGEEHAILGGVGFVADLFLRLLRMIIVPLVFATIVTAVANLPLRHLGRMGGRALGFYALTTTLAIGMGLLLVNLIRPGDGVDVGVSRPRLPEPSPLSEVLLGIVPENPLASMAETFDLLGVIFFAILLGAALSAIGKEGAPVHRFFEALSKVMLRMTGWILRTAPIGIFALVFGVVVETGPAVFISMLRYVLTVAGALTLHATVTLPVLLWLFTGIAAWRLARLMAPALVTAFSTASSAAALPLAMENMEQRAGADKRASGFVLPLGSTVNMDGTALYEAVAALFIAQAFGIDLTLGQQLLVLITALLAAIGAAGVPSAGLVMLILVLEAVGLPLEGIALLLAVDRVLDMMRTTVNVWGDCVTTVVVAHHEGLLHGDVLREGEHERALPAGEAPAEPPDGTP